MKAMVYNGDAHPTWTEHPDPVIHEGTDIIVKMTATTICGTDLHILKGDNPSTPVGCVLGHEGVGIVSEVGENVKQLKVGDRVVVSCVTSCGHCKMCRDGLPSHCLDPEGEENMGWLLGNMLDGTQAEYVRVPFGENSVFKIADSVSDAEAILLSDILPTGFEIGIQNGGVKPGDVVAIIGSGPVGLAAVMTARLYGPSRIISIDLDDNRLARAKDFGATDTVNNSKEGWQAEVLAMTDGYGVDVAIEAVGIPATFQAALDILRPGGTLANVGVHGKPVELPINELWAANINITTGLVNANTVEMLSKMVEAKKLPTDKFVTHEFSFDQFEEAYDVFINAAKHDALKVLIH